MTKNSLPHPNPKRIVQRIIGSEMEFGFRGNTPDQDWNFLIARMNRVHRGAIPKRHNFLMNQGCIYSDTGLHPEYCTPECLGSRQAALYETAGLYIMARALRKWRRELSDHGQSVPRLALYHNNRDTTLTMTKDLMLTSWGSHTSYLTLRSLQKKGLFRTLSNDEMNAQKTQNNALWPFLATRWCIIGNAWLDFFNESSAHFLLSQRADIMKLMPPNDSQSTTGIFKPLLNTRDEALADSGIWHRLHDISGNATISQTQSWLKYGTMDLVLALLENQPSFAVPQFHATITSNAICGQFNRDIRAKTTVLLADGRRVRAIDIQRMYIEAILRLLKREEYLFTEERKAVLDLWIKVIDAIERWDMPYLGRILDWAIILHNIVEPIFAKIGIDLKPFLTLPQDRRGYCDYGASGGIERNHTIQTSRGPQKIADYLLQAIVNYANVEIAQSPYGVLLRAGKIDTLFTETEIQEAADDPPQRTRARLRQALWQLSRAHDWEIDFGWDSAHMSYRGRCVDKTLLNPYRFRILMQEKKALEDYL